MAFDAKALSETNRQVSWLSHPIQHLLRRLLSPMANSPVELFLVIYSCATAHELHVIPSWPPCF